MPANLYKSVAYFAAANEMVNAFAALKSAAYFAAARFIEILRKRTRFACTQSITIFFFIFHSIPVMQLSSKLL